MPGSTLDSEYAERLHRRSETPWKKLLDVQRPYRWNLRRLKLGRTLDIGCGIGRNLVALDASSVGVDHNEQCVAIARERGFRAYTPQAFSVSADARLESFDALLFAHVLEHMDAAAADRLIGGYLPFLKRGGRIVVITPQEAGFRSDDTHVRFVDFAAIGAHANRWELQPRCEYSFPFPRWVGRIFPYNEFVFVGSRRGTLK